NAAGGMAGRTPPEIQVLRPLKDGVIEDFQVVEVLLRHLMMNVFGRRLWVGPRALICVPYGTTEVERRAIRESCEAAGAREVYLLDRPIAAAVGAELPVKDARGHMVIDMGGGTTDVSVLSLGGIVYNRTIKVGGLHFDQVITDDLLERNSVQVGPRTVERLKLALGDVSPRDPGTREFVKGRSSVTGFPVAVEVTSAQVRAALQEPLKLVVDAVLSSLEHTPPDLATDIAETGLLLMGGGAHLRGLDRVVGDATDLPVIVPEDPETTVVLGAGQVLEDPELLVDLAL
ncbi:MAG: rod shape-determining protein, partial [Myxococcota bacterium]|nr:rod shape-determining protein [Myxococcota bacterium]